MCGFTTSVFYDTWPRLSMAKLCRRGFWEHEHVVCDRWSSGTFINKNKRIERNTANKAKVPFVVLTFFYFLSL